MLPASEFPRSVGGGAQKIVFDEALMGPLEQGQDLIALDDALKILVEVDPRKAQVVELRFFGGMTVEETAQTLKVSPDTVLRDWRLAAGESLAKTRDDQGEMRTA